MDSWDIGNAFLQGLRIDELREKAKELGLETKNMRNVYLMPPKNVWRHLRSIPGSTIKVSSLECSKYVLLLLKPMYGTRDAAQNLQNEYTQFMIGLGFRVGRASPCNFYNPEMDITCTVHGNDFTSCGPGYAVAWSKTTDTDQV